MKVFLYLLMILLIIGCLLVPSITIRIAFVIGILILGEAVNEINKDKK